MVEQAGEQELDTKRIPVPWSPGQELSMGEFMLQMVQHLDRHKCQLFYYLKLQGKAVTTSDLWYTAKPAPSSAGAAG